MYITIMTNRSLAQSASAELLATMQHCNRCLTPSYSDMQTPAKLQRIAEEYPHLLTVTVPAWALDQNAFGVACTAESTSNDEKRSFQTWQMLLIWIAEQLRLRHELRRDCAARGVGVDPCYNQFILNEDLLPRLLMSQVDKWKKYKRQKDADKKKQEKAEEAKLRKQEKERERLQKQQEKERERRRKQQEKERAARLKKRKRARDDEDDDTEDDEDDGDFEDAAEVSEAEEVSQAEAEAEDSGMSDPADGDGDKEAGAAPMAVDDVEENADGAEAEDVDMMSDNEDISEAGGKEESAKEMFVKFKLDSTPYRLVVEALVDHIDNAPTVRRSNDNVSGWRLFLFYHDPNFNPGKALAQLMQHNNKQKQGHGSGKAARRQGGNKGYAAAGGPRGATAAEEPQFLMGSMRTALDDLDSIDKYARLCGQLLRDDSAMRDFEEHMRSMVADALLSDENKPFWLPDVLSLKTATEVAARLECVSDEQCSEYNYVDGARIQAAIPQLTWDISFEHTKPRNWVTLAFPNYQPLPTVKAMQPFINDEASIAKIPLMPTSDIVLRTADLAKKLRRVRVVLEYIFDHPIPLSEEQQAEQDNEDEDDEKHPEGSSKAQRDLERRQRIHWFGRMHDTTELRHDSAALSDKYKQLKALATLLYESDPAALFQVIQFLNSMSIRELQIQLSVASTKSPYLAPLLRWSSEWLDTHENFCIPRKKKCANLTTFADSIAVLMQEFEHVYSVSTLHSVCLIGYASYMNAYDTNRREKLHIIITGKYGTSKSFIIMLLKRLGVPGTLQTLSYMSANADNVNGDNDYLVECWEEAPQVIFKWANDKGQEDRFKSKLTAGEQEVRLNMMGVYKTPTAEILHNKCNGPIIACTNHSVDDISPAMLSRFLVVTVGGYMREHNTIIEKIASADMASDSLRQREQAIQDQFRRNQYLVFMIFQLIQIGALPPIDLSLAHCIFTSTLKRSAASGLSNCFDPRHYNRLLLMYKVLVVLNAISVAFDYPGSVFHERPWKAADLRMLAPLLGPSLEIAIFSLTLLGFQYENPVQRQVMEAMVSVYFTPAVELKENMEVFNYGDAFKFRAKGESESRGFFGFAHSAAHHSSFRQRADQNSSSSDEDSRSVPESMPAVEDADTRFWFEYDYAVSKTQLSSRGDTLAAQLAAASYSRNKNKQPQFAPQVHDPRAADILQIVTQVEKVMEPKPPRSEIEACIKNWFNSPSVASMENTTMMIPPLAVEEGRLLISTAMLRSRHQDSTLARYALLTVMTEGCKQRPLMLGMNGRMKPQFMPITIVESQEGGALKLHNPLYMNRKVRELLDLHELPGDQSLQHKESDEENAPVGAEADENPFDPDNEFVYIRDDLESFFYERWRRVHMITDEMLQETGFTDRISVEMEIHNRCFDDDTDLPYYPDQFMNGPADLQKWKEDTKQVGVPEQAELKKYAQEQVELMLKEYYASQA